MAKNLDDDDSSREKIGEEEEVYKKKGAKYDYNKFKKTRWVTAEMGKYFERDIFLVLHARETIIYIFFVICVTIAALGLVDGRMFFMTHSLRGHLKDQAGYPNPTMGETSEVKYDDIGTVSEMWDYIENHFIMYVHARSSPGDGKFFIPVDNETFEHPNVRSARRSRQAGIAAKPDVDVDDNNSTDIEPELGPPTVQDRGLGFENILVGRAVIRAVMIDDIECPPPFPAIFIRCYPSYTRSGRKTTSSEGLYMYHEASDTMAEPFTGKVAHYQADGFQEKLGPTYEDSKATINRLKNGRYITKNTRAIFIDAAYYNPSVNLFCAVKLLFELPPSGGVVPSSYFYTLRLDRHVTTFDHVALGFEIVSMALVVFFIIEDLRSMMFVKMKYFLSFWNYVSMLIIATSISYFILRFIQVTAVNKVMREMRVNINDYVSFQTVTRNELFLRNVLAINIFTVYLKIFKYMSFNWTMTILNRTLTKCLTDVFAFVLMFVVMFLAFALFGALCFGTHIRHFSTIGQAMFALLRTMLGDYEYAEFEEAEKFVAPYYYLLFVFLVFFILLVSINKRRRTPSPIAKDFNQSKPSSTRTHTVKPQNRYTDMNMFLAIINDTYSDAKTELAISPPQKRVSDFWSTGVYNIMRQCGCKVCAPKRLVAASHINPSAEEIRDALRRCGYSDLDIDLFLGRYNIDPDAQVRVKDVSQLIAQMRFEGPKRKAKRTKRDKGTHQPPIIAMDDFAEQQENLEKVEATMRSVVEKLDALLEKLKQTEKRKKPKPPED